jgi:hypothetical protein
MKTIPLSDGREFRVYLDHVSYRVGRAVDAYLARILGPGERDRFHSWTPIGGRAWELRLERGHIGYGLMVDTAPPPGGQYFIITADPIDVKRPEDYNLPIHEIAVWTGAGLFFSDKEPVVEYDPFELTVKALYGK